jgi:hypothetical protein
VFVLVFPQTIRCRPVPSFPIFLGFKKILRLVEEYPICNITIRYTRMRDAIKFTLRAGIESS